MAEIRTQIKKILIIAFVFLFTLLCFVPRSIFAEEETSKSVTLTFLDMDKTIHEWDFPYSDDFFRQPSDSFSLELARSSLGLAICSARNNGEVIDNQFEPFLTELGFSDIVSFGYEAPTSENTLSGVIASKKIDDFTLIAVSPCGLNYKKEWIGNLMVGDGERHEGFSVAADILKTQIAEYIEGQNLTGEIKFWFAGFSRAAAVSNLTAGDLLESGVTDSVYAYLFGVPRTTKVPKEYPGIFNLCGAFDPVPWIPLETWGYYRNGTDYFMPAQETDADYTKMLPQVDNVSRKVVERPFVHNPLTNYRLHLICEFLGELFPTDTDYKKTLQPELMEAMRNRTSESMFSILQTVFLQLDDLDQREQASSSIFIDYLSLVGSEQLRNNEKEIKLNHWDPALSLFLNYMTEHRPITYIDWLFSGVSPDKLFVRKNKTRHFVIEGKVDVMVFHDYQFAGMALQNGELIYPNELSDDKIQDFLEVFLTRNGSLTTVIMPEGEEYEVDVVLHKNDGFSYYMVDYVSEKLAGEGLQIGAGLFQKGYYSFKIGPGIALPAPLELDPQTNELNEVDDNRYSVLSFDYSPTMIMSAETVATGHPTLSKTFLALIIVFFGLILFGLICLVIAIVHKVRKKKRTRPFSNLYVIVPHLILIAFFGFLTQYFTLNFFVIGVLKQSVAAFNIFLIFLLALRGLLRCLRAKESKGYKEQPGKKKVLGAIYCVVLLGLSVLTWFFFKQSIFATYTAGRCIAYFAIITALSVLAFLLFPIRKKKETSQ
ncbi:MAG: hypothetical protein IKE48_04165 [Parasporobacterium sp.]|nr:hypothetical protein [Parasporobacterium sp.]